MGYVNHGLALNSLSGDRRNMIGCYVHLPMVGVVSRDYEGHGCPETVPSEYQRRTPTSVFGVRGGPPVGRLGSIGAVQQSMLYCEAVVSVRRFLALFQPARSCKQAASVARCDL